MKKKTKKILYSVGVVLSLGVAIASDILVKQFYGFIDEGLNGTGIEYTPEAREMINYFKDMNEKHYLGIPYTWEEESYCSNPFKALKLAMTISSSAGLSYNIAAGAKFKIGIAPVPYKSADKKFVISQGTNIAMLKANEYQNLSIGSPIS